MRSRGPLQLQVGPLRVPEAATVTRVGGKESLAIDVASSPRARVEGAAAASKVEEDLFYPFILPEEDVGFDSLPLGVTGAVPASGVMMRVAVPIAELEPPPSKRRAPCS
jgi:hypothetical protein